MTYTSHRRKDTSGDNAEQQHSEAHTTPRAHIVHRLSDRLRLKIVEKRRDAAWFDEVAASLEQIPGVIQVESRPLSGSFLIRHEPDDLLEQRLRQSGLFQFSDPTPPSAPVLDTLTDVVSRSDQALERRTGGRTNLRSLLILVLVALAILQTLRGRILVPAASLVIFAAQLALTARNRE